VAAASTSGTSLSTSARQTFRDRGLADAGFAHEQRVILLPAAQDLEARLIFGIGVRHRIDLARRAPSC